MGSYEIDQEGYLNYTGDGWSRTKKPLTENQITMWKNNEIDFEDLEWE